MPETPGKILLVILESLAFRYREAVDELSEIRYRKLDVLHIISGGQNRLLNQFGANTTRIPVHVGPFEATSVGNILVQIIVVKDLARLAEGRALVNVSFPNETYLPSDSDIWEEQFNQWKSAIIWTN
jgi:rhamnulokinase